MTAPKPELLGDLAGVSIEAGVSAFTGEAFLIIRATRPDGAELYGQLDPATVRTMALQWLAEAAAAEVDASLFGMILESRLAGGEPLEEAQASAGAIVNAARHHRHEAGE